MELAESVQRVLRAADVFGELFYEEFFRRCPEAKPYFEGHDMKRQALIMTMTLQSVQQYADGGYPAVDHYIEHLGAVQVHQPAADLDRLAVHRRRNIPMKMYPQFRAAMLHVLGRLLSDVWDRDLRQQWETALDKSVRAMLKGYESPGGI